MIPSGTINGEHTETNNSKNINWQAQQKNYIDVMQLNTNAKM